MCFLMMGCSDIPHKTSLSHIPPAPVYKDTVCDIDAEKKALIKDATILNKKTNDIIKQQNIEAQNYEIPHKKK